MNRPVTNRLVGSREATQGLGASYVNTNAPYQHAKPAVAINPNWAGGIGSAHGNHSQGASAEIDNGKGKRK